MQLVHQKENVVEKILRDTNGQLVRATFCVYEQGGRIKARLIKVVLMEEKPIQNQTLFLGGNVQKQSIQSGASSNPIVSPYINSSLLYFLGSKPRAPAYTK